MDVQTISSTSNEFLRAEVSARIATGYENVTAGTASMAIVAAGVEPVTGDFQAAAWETGGPPYYMRRLSGLLTNGTYDVWSRVQLATEDVRKKVFTLIVT